MCSPGDWSVVDWMAASEDWGALSLNLSEEALPAYVHTLTNAERDWWPDKVIQEDDDDE